MEIACSINKKFTRHMCVMLKSLLINSSEDKVNVHVLNTALTKAEENYILNLFEKEKRISFKFYKVDEDVVKDIPIVAESLTIETLYRILLPVTISNDINKIIYIDSDIIIKSDINEVYNIDIDDYYLAAVPDIYETILETIKFENITDYFNAGFILINLKKWREDNFIDKCLEFAMKYPERIQLADQDVLNGVLNGEWYRLPLKWNVVRNMIFNTGSYYKYYDKNLVDNAIKNPALIHYSSANKPWHIFDKHPYREEYHKYSDMLKDNHNKYEELDFLKHSKVVLFGTGEMSEFYTGVLKDAKVPIDFYVDNNDSKWGQLFKGKEIKDPAILKDANVDYFIFIASQYYDEIKTQLLDYEYEAIWEYFTRNKI